MNREQIRQENRAIQKRYETKYFARVKEAIQIPIDRTIQIVKGQGVKAGLFYLQNELANTSLTVVIQQLALEVGLRFARRTWTNLQMQRRAAKCGTIYFYTKNAVFNENPKPTGEINLKAGFGFNQAWTDWIKNFLFDFIVTKISFSVFETTKDVLFTVLNEAVREGWGIDKTVKALDSLPLPATQAARIVRTEITRAANAGAMAAGSTFPFQQAKEWISAHDNRVRGTDPNDHASHVALDGNVVDYEDSFMDPRNGDLLMFPGDPQASAESTVNCRCAVAVVGKIGENGRLIPKRTQAIA